ncbi:NPC intracellular cholesterol transporter 2-like [Mercenaria mercenaria]|uniref:NPC intracellular cholesterol transporter 2-like n=1 Tax=Mercenaria mercenaria TaxID=6596 RepID=UPI00234F5937|nr:NPC intracellular cholesterol transporter 2-like [Mercenaria mercenaria]
MRFLGIVVLFAVISSCPAVILTDYTRCESHGTINSILFEPCQKEPCHVQGSQNYTAQVNFTAHEHSMTLENIYHGFFAGVQVPFEVNPKDACTDSGIHCPLIPGESHVYVANVTIPAYATSVGMRLAGQWEVRDDTGHNLMCFVFPLILT